jgi:NSS family neurotransmitter:Na+ symporter
MVGQYGGGSFIVAFVVSMIVIVLPLAIVECGIGKGFGKGMIGVFTEALHSKIGGKILGSIFALGYYTMNFFYYVVMAASVYFVYSSAISEWNVIPADQIYAHFFENKLELAIISVLLVMATIYVVMRGVEAGIEKMSKIIIPLMFVFFIIVAIFGIFCIDNIQLGYNWYLEPSLDVLKTPDIWLAALGQALFSVGIGPGCVLIYGSHLKKTSDITLNMTTVCLLTGSVGVIVGMGLIPACIAMGINPQSGSMLIFVVIPSLLSRLPAGNIIGVLLFFAIVFAGFSSAIAQLEIAVATFATDLKWGRKKAGYILGIINIFAAICAAYSEAFYNFWNDFSGNYLFIVTAGIGAIVYVYVFKIEWVRLVFLNPCSDIRVGPWFSKFVKFVAAPLMILCMLNSVFPWILSAKNSFARNVTETTLTMSTIVTLVVVVGGLFTATIYMLNRCIHTQERTPEAIAAYEEEHKYVEK